ncbi:phage tail tape measure protein [Gracilibacillus sp. JCM 18860]|uniref:phage tail tape measure protein n=1 Tax=Gracilibacillus sp. JCM 18860 TaxID=1306159 RepID=UPI0032606923
MGTAAGLAASSYEDSAVRIQNSLGLTAEEAKELTDISRNIYKNGFGESADQIDHALLQVKQNIRDLNKEDLESITEKAFLLAETFESDVNEVTRAGNNLMKGFGIEAEEAFDLMARGAQNGLNFSNEMFDNLSEYSTLFGSMGFSAEEYFELLSNGMEAGGIQPRYINDVMKEFQIRVKDGSDTTKDAMGRLSKDTQKVWKEFLKGNKTVKDVSNAILKELEGMDDQVKANEIGVELYGTKWEDLEAEAMYSLGGIGDGLGDVEGAMDDMTKNAEKSISRQWKSTWREAKSVLLPVGETLLDFTKEVLPDVQEGVEDVTEWFSELDEEGRKNIVMLGGIAAAAGPVLSIVGGLSTGIGGLMKITGGLSKVIGVAGGKGLLGRIGLMGITGGPVGLAIAGVTTLGGVVYTLHKISQKSNEEILNSIQARKEEIESLDGLINQYETLKEKNKLSTDEMLRYMDIATELKDAKTEETIRKLKDEQAELLKKSTLTNKEMKDFLKLNDGIVDKTPTTVQAISEQGNAYVGVLDKVKELNQAERERLTADTYQALTSGLEEQKKNLEEQREIQSEIKNLEGERSLVLQDFLGISDQTREKDQEIANIKSQIKLADEEEAIRLSEKLVKLEDEKAGLDAIREKHDQEIGKLDVKLEKKQESLNKNKKEIEDFERIAGEYEALILSQVGLNSERGKGLEVLDQEIGKHIKIRNGLKDQKDAGELTTQEYNKRVREAQNEIDKLRGAKGALEDVNKVAGLDVYSKRITGAHKEGLKIDEVKRKANITNNILGEDIDKDVNVDDHGTADKVHDEATKKGKKNVDVSLTRQNSIWDIVPNVIDVGVNFISKTLGFADGTDSHPGGVSWLGGRRSRVSKTRKQMGDG